MILLNNMFEHSPTVTVLLIGLNTYIQLANNDVRRFTLYFRFIIISDWSQSIVSISLLLTNIECRWLYPAVPCMAVQWHCMQNWFLRHSNSQSSHRIDIIIRLVAECIYIVFYEIQLSTVHILWHDILKRIYRYRTHYLKSIAAGFMFKSCKLQIEAFVDLIHGRKFP